MIRAPFNFVPVNDQPYLPDVWATQISHDIPFEDGISGSLALTIQARTPVFISDTVHDDNTIVHEFCNIVDSNGEKHYFIPGTSIKGMIRNVMEILSFGKMSQVQNQSFGIRDLSNGTDGLFYRAKVKVDNVHCGWLRMTDSGYSVDDCGLPWRISAEEIDRKFHIGLLRFIQDGKNFKSDANKTALKKYQMFRDAYLDEEQLTDYFVTDSGNGISAGGRKFVCFGQGGNIGTIVFTGQPGVRKQKYDEKKKKMIWSGKFFEFVFPEEVENENVPVPENVFKSFESIHQNSSDYVNFRKKQLRKGEAIPVFFIYDENGNIDTMGISYMFKFPAFNSVYNGIPLPLLSQEKHDLCECIFGYTGKAESLKGRVSFTAAKLQGNATLCNTVRLALAKPHPSYYPLYLGQGQTWNSENVRIAGRKRYPVRNADYLLRSEGTDNMSRTIQPLDKGTVFKGVIHFHNLRPIELGALVSAIDFCQHEECYHSIGQGKPLGYGKVKLSVTEYDLQFNSESKRCNLDNAREAFTSEMSRKFNGWSNSPQLSELFAMARGIPNDRVSEFQYMKMSITGEDNEFKQGLSDYAKGKQLGSFTQILLGTVQTIRQQSNVSVNAKREDIELRLASEQKERELALAKQQERKEQELAKERAEELLMERKKKTEEIANQAREAMINKNYKEAIDLFKKAASYGIDTFQAIIDECQAKIDEMITLQSGIQSYLETIKLASIPAFANNMKKRNNIAPIIPEDAPFIIRKITSDWNMLKSNERNNWLDRKKWSPIEKELGADITNTIFEGVKAFLTK